MKSLLIADLKISLALALFYVVYRLVLGNDTFFIRNRFYLLFAMLLSFIVPWLRFETKVYKEIPAVQYYTNNVTIPLEQTKEATMWSVVLEVVFWIYLLGVLFYLVRFVWAYKKVIRLIINSEKKKFQDLILVITRLSVAPFSLLKWLVVPAHQMDHPGFENIVQHESIHCRQYHSVDLFLAELMVAFQWFNPFAWWLKNSMVENHEFIVDRAILQKGMDSRKYQYLLLSFSTGSYQPAMVNYFNSNLLKKRIRMMNKTRSPRWYGIKNCMILITLAIVVAFGATFETKIIAQELEKHPLLVINGKKTDKTVQSLNAENVQRINVIKDTTVAVAKYGRDAAHGVIEVVMIDSLESAKPVTMADVKVEAYGTHKDASMSNSSDEVTVLGYGQIKDSKNPLVIVDGKKINFNEINNYKPNSITVLKGEEAVNLYGDEGKNGVLIISTKGKTSKEEFIIRNSNTLKEPLYVVNGQIVSKEEGNKIKPEDISSLNVLKDDQAVNKYGTSGKDGVVEITLKNQVHVETNNSLIIVPNPSSDNVEVTLKGVQPTGKLDVKVYDKHGKLIYQDKKTGPTFDLSVTGMETGSYFVIVSEKNNIYKGKLIVGQ